MHEGTGWCEGCLRTIDEIAAWGALDDRLRREVLALLPERRRRWRGSRASRMRCHRPRCEAPRP
jgi:predicted Fe-S protein YdhL (DUF1289 family)